MCRCCPFGCDSETSPWCRLGGCALSLLGNLADLGLGDIFQIVSLSRRSGTLQLTTPNDSGEIVFTVGRVIAAYRTGATQSVGEGLLERGAFSPTIYQELLAAQASGAQGPALFSHPEVKLETVEGALAELLKRAIFHMFDWDEGTFSFVLDEQPDPWRGFTLTGTRVLVQHGLNPQYLAIEGARVRDERTKEDTLESFLARDRQKGVAAKPHPHDAESFAAKLRETFDFGDDQPQGDRPAADAALPLVAGSASNSPAASPAGPAALAAAGPAPVSAAVSAAVSPALSAAVSPAVSPAAAELVSPAAVAVAAPEPIVPVASSPAREAPAPVLCEPASESREAADPEKVIPLAAARARRDAKPRPPAPEPAVAAPVAAGAPGASRRRLLIIDDDPQVTKHIAGAFASRVAEVVTANSVSEALPEIDACRPDLLVATDLIIARSDGGGILGGIEVLERVRHVSPSTPVVLFSDYENAEAEQKAARLSVEAFLMKPRKAQIQATREKGTLSPPMQEFLEKLGAALRKHMEEPVPSPANAEAPAAAQPTAVPASSAVPAPTAVPAPAAASGAAASPASPTQAPPVGVSPLLYDLRREMSGEIADINIANAAGLPPEQPLDGPMGTLRSMLAELINPTNRDTVTLLVLRFASCVLERSALFLVTRRAFVGLGGFSIEESSDLFVNRVRRMQMPVDMESLFAKVTRYRASFREPLEANDGNRLLVAGVGGRWPTQQVLAMPLISGDRVAAILYGDNPSGKELGPTATLEIFLQQAGLAMDRALLERKLEESRRKLGESE